MGARAQRSVAGVGGRPSSSPPCRDRHLDHPFGLGAKGGHATIPIVFFIAGDPVALGLVGSLNRPSSNFTGTTTLTLEVGTKWLQLLHEMVPAATGFAIMLNPTSPDLAKVQARDLQAAASTLGLQVHLLHAASDRDFDAVFARVKELQAGGLIDQLGFLFLHPR